MSVVAVIGGQWGDEGKGKIIDLLSERANMVARFSGGSNAGHTVLNPYGEFRMHLVPSGIFHPEVVCIIGNGVVLDPKTLLEELESLHSRGVETKNLYISDRAHLVMPYHLLLDSLEEEARGGGALGTTRKGIGPAFVDKVQRLGIRAGELLDKENFLERLHFVLEQKNLILTRVYGAKPLSLEEVYQDYCQYGERLRPFIRETEVMVEEAAQRGDRVLLEGSQGTMLDIDFGTYPYVTSCSAIVGGSCPGLGLSPIRIDRIIGVFKAYTTRVGAGPMPTELFDETGELIRERAHEYGATTGRPRRCGWFDGVACRLSSQLNGFTGIALTRLDILDVFPSLKICTGYKVDGETITRFPSSIAFLERCQPLWEEVEGGECDISGARQFDDLPPQARSYVRRLEEIIGCPVDLISVGPRREETIMVREII